MIGWAGTLLAAWFLLLAIDGNSGVELCRRLTLTGLTEDNTAYVQLGLGGVFEVQDDQYNGFPVLKMNNIYFFYDEPYRRFAMGFELGKLALIGATVSSTFDKNTWLRTADPARPFDRAINRWFEVLIGSQRLTFIYGEISLRCVDDDFQTCDSQRLEFDELLTQVSQSGELIYLNVPGQHYYQQLPDEFHNNRPVFERRNGSALRIFYDTAWRGWIVGSDYPRDSAAMVVKEKAWSPEYIMSDWTLYTEGEFRPVSAKLRCLGVSKVLGYFCRNSNDTCQNGGQCHQLTNGDDICICKEGFYGMTCEQNKARCPIDNFKSDYLEVIRNGNYMGSVGTFFCHQGYEPKYFYAVCEANSGTSTVGQWKGIQECSLKTTTTTLEPTSSRWRSSTQATTRTTTPYYHRSWKEEEPAWVYTVTICLAFFIQLALPFIIYYMLRRRSNYLDEEQRKLKAKQHGVLEKKLTAAQNEVDKAVANGTITAQEGQDEKAKIDYKFADLEQQDKEIRQKIKANRKVKNISFGRVYSISFNIGIWFWLPYLIVCSELQLKEQSRVFDGLWIPAIVHVVLGYLWMFGESLVSREYSYLSKLSDTEYAAIYLKDLRETPPHMIMQAQCYHWETRTRVVTYRDANGNTQTRLETYQERVVTHIDSEVFRYGYWVDNSNDRFEFCETFGVTKIKLKKNIRPGDVETNQCLQDAEDAFREKNRHYDTFMDYTLQVLLPNFESRIAAYTDPAKKSWWIKRKYFWLATLLCMTWPYRWLFRARTGRARYKIEKIFYMRCPEQVTGMTAYNISEEQQALLTKVEAEDNKEDNNDDKSRKNSQRKSKKKKVPTATLR